MLVSAIHQHESAIVYSLNHVQLCDPMDCRTPGFPVLHYPPEFAQTHVHWVNWCHPTTSSSVTPFSCLQSLPASGSFPVSWLFVSGGQSIGASVPVLPMTMQGWLPLELTGFISLRASKGSQEFSLAPPFESINSPVLSLLYGPTLTSENDYQKTIALIMQTFVSKVMPLLSNMLSFFVLVTQSCPALCDPMDYSLPGSSVHGILQVKKLEWVAFPSPGDLPNPGLPHCEQILYSQSHQGGPIGCLGL